ncbi:MAG: hypothetical protein OXG82_22455 [Gammaproteobacteria bacterium]|nr:hypothetical protein [Gammaproteobacteria bacterium]
MAVAVEDRLALEPLGGEQHAGALAGSAEYEVEVVGLRAFLRRHGGADLELRTVVVVAENDVHHAAERVGAINGGSAVGEDLHAVDGDQRNGVQVHGRRTGERIARHAPTVDQDGRAIRAQAAQVDERDLAET